MANTLNVFRGGAVGFIDWLDVLCVPWLPENPDAAERRQNKRDDQNERALHVRQLNTFSSEFRDSDENLTNCHR